MRRIVVAQSETELQGLLASKGSHADNEALKMRAAAEKLGLSEEDYSAALAGGKILNHLMDSDHNQCGMSASIYDAAFVMPQICRSATWPRSFTLILLRSYLLLMLNFFFQLFILYMLATEEEVMDKYAGQMNLCNFGANVQDCPDGPNCIGPSGTNFKNAGRMYSYSAWSTRTFVRDSLKQMFPNKADEIMEKVDPGEYGVENFWVRYVCVFIFMMSVMSDLRSTMDMAYILYYVPCKDEPWLTYEVPTWASKEEVKYVKDSSELDFVKFRIAGMSKMWKAINTMLIIIPKLFIWKKTAKYGVMFLMETAGIEDVIVNVTALTFILNMDEMLFQAFAHNAVHHILVKLEPFCLEDHASRENLTLEDTYNTLLKDKAQTTLYAFSPFPFRLVATIFFTAIFVSEYYWVKCEFSETGGLVSRTENLPLDQVFSFARFFFPWVREPLEDSPYWSMPSPKK